MVSVAYMNGRRNYQRPQAVLLANNPGTIATVDGSSYYVPTGTELEDFIILTDNNRDQIQISQNRIEKRERTINGRMRSYHIADKLKLTLSWKMIPSRAFAEDPAFDPETGETSIPKSEWYTTDGGVAGVEMLNWYENNPGSFWIFLSYDKYNNFTADSTPYDNLAKYSQVIEVFFSDFSHNVIKRGGTNYDFWDVNFSLEEV